MEKPYPLSEWYLDPPSQALAGARPVPGWQRTAYFAVKRLLDVLIAGTALIVLALPLLCIAALICLDSPGPAIFRQQRLTARRRRGPHGEQWEIVPFTCLKFRSMVHNASPELHRAFVQAFISNDREHMVALQGEQTQECKLVNDPRTTRIGRLIRKTSIDELPQLWNVLKGEMSLVGPRPPIPYEVDMYQPWHHRRLRTRPGLTGLWQVTRRSAADFDEMVRLDIWYIEHQNLWLDLKILMMTPAAVFSQKGAR
jgi:lipopolysaccharide/colanic/teichoic acid biosynthesis glycosyltransferase